MKLNRVFDRKNKILMFNLYFFFALLIIHLLLPLNWADDAVFFKKSSQLALSEFLNNSARPFVDTLTYFFTKYPLLWRFINPIMLMLLSFILSKYLPSNNEYSKTVAVSFAIIYPSMIVVDAGFIATTLNYLWPVTLGLFCLLPLWKKVNNLKLKWFEMVILLPCLLYATNMQQMSVILVLVLGSACIYFTLKKEPQLYIFLQFIISVFCALYSYRINTVGDNSRMLRETKRYFPNFESLSFFEKIDLGFSSTFYSLTSEICFAWFGFFAFLLVLTIFVFKKSDKIKDRIVVFFPLIFSFFGALQSILPIFKLSSKKYIFGELQNYKMNKATYSFEFIADVFFVIVILCIMYSLLILIKNNKERIAAFTVFLLGLGTRIIMGFSPTVWASGNRTFYIMFISFIIIIFLIINENQENQKFQPKHKIAV